MIFNKLTMYKVTEFAGGLVITSQADKLKDSTAVPLMQGASGDVVEYLARYLHARENGKGRKEAHLDALAGAKILMTEGRS